MKPIRVYFLALFSAAVLNAKDKRWEEFGATHSATSGVVYKL
ncbi:MAG TPA: hypothetical protein VGG72_25195 [Bryobacteraceae bacterium]